MTNKKYMVVAGYQNGIRNNLEIVDFNIDYETAQNLVAQLKDEQARCEVDEDWIIDEEPKIVEYLGGI